MLPPLHGLLLALAPFAGAAATPRPAVPQGLELRSADGTHLARIARLDDAARPALRGRWQLTVIELRGAGRDPRELWHAFVPEPDPASTYLLTDDGGSLCRVEPRLDPPTGEPAAARTERERDEPPTLVEVWRRGRRTAAFDSEDLRFVPDEIEPPTRWIEPSHDTLRLRRVRIGATSERTVLDLLAVDGGVRAIDLETGEVAVSADARDGPDARPRVAPTVPLDVETQLERVFVRSWSAPEEVAGNQGFEVRVRGSFPTPGWRVVGFGVELLEEDADEPLIAVTPYAARLGGDAAAQVITHFDSTCTLEVPRPGRYRLELHGREPAEITRTLVVSPTALYVSLTTSGGFAGIEHEVVVRLDGRLTAGGRTTLVSEQDFAELASRVDALPAESRAERSQGNDLFQYDLAWVRDGRIVRATFDDGTLVSPWRDAVQALTRLGSREPPVVRAAALRPVAEESELYVRVTTAGPNGSDHVLRARELKGEVVLDREVLGASTLVLIVDAASLTAAGDGGTDATLQPLRAALDPERHPRIVFRSTRIEAKRLGPTRFDAVVHGELTVRDVTRPARFSALVELEGAGVRARGRGPLKLSDFDLRPNDAAGGAIADAVELRFDLVAR